MKKIICLILLIFTGIIYAQFPPTFRYYNVGSKNNFEGFKYKNLYYENSPRGIKNFMTEHKSDFSPELQAQLNKKLQNIKTKSLISNIGGYGLFAVGAIIMGKEAINKTGENGDLNSNEIFTGFGICVLGGLIKEFVRPKNKHYFDFINAVNKEQNQKINIELSLNLNNNLNFGLAINF